MGEGWSLHTVSLIGWVHGGAAWAGGGSVLGGVSVGTWLWSSVAWSTVLSGLVLWRELGINGLGADLWSAELGLSDLLSVVGLLKSGWVSSLGGWLSVVLTLWVVLSWVVSVSWLWALNVSPGLIISSLSGLVVSWLNLWGHLDLVLEELVAWSLVWDVLWELDVGLSHLVVLWHHALVLVGGSLVLWVLKWGLLTDLDNTGSWSGTELLLSLEHVWGTWLVVLALWLVLVLDELGVASEAIAWGLLEDLLVVVNTSRSSADGSLLVGTVWLVLAAVAHVVWSDELVHIEWLLVGGWLIKWVNLSPAGVVVTVSPVHGSVLWHASLSLWELLSWVHVWVVSVLWTARAISASLTD